jgi:hypothetical protein
MFPLPTCGTIIIRKIGELEQIGLQRRVSSSVSVFVPLMKFVYVSFMFLLCSFYVLVHNLPAA